MEKSKEYWSLHKEVYMSELDKLDNSIINIIQTKPNSKEAYLFNEKVETKIKEEMQKTLSL
tara:strand:+ start:330 stop:512 length:183 start_codon:yes stop_codon:yes gene_type:complete